MVEELIKEELRKLSHSELVEVILQMQQRILILKKLLHIIDLKEFE